MSKKLEACDSFVQNATDRERNRRLIVLFPHLKERLAKELRRQPPHVYDLAETEIYKALLIAAESYDPTRQPDRSLESHFRQLADWRVINAICKSKAQKRGGGVNDVRQSTLECATESRDWENLLPPASDSNDIFSKAVGKLCLRRLKTMEREVLRLHASGYMIEEIARQLGVSVSTTKRQLKSAFRKMKYHYEQFERALAEFVSD